MAILKRFTPFVLSLVTFFPVSTYAQNQTVTTVEVVDLLRGMSMALRTLNYQGTFTYEHSGALDTFKVVHNVADGREFERLQYLSGPDRAVIREQRDSNCLGVADLILRGQLGELFKQYPGLSEYYDIFVRGEDRVAGRNVLVIHIAPKDDYRFGQSLALDKETLLPLRLLTLNKMQVLERFQFVDVTLGEEAIHNKAELAANEVNIDKGLNCDKTKAATATAWQFGWVPKGFAMMGARQTGALGEMVMFTDGISSFSVFVKSVSDPQTLEALRGATVVYMAPFQGASESYRVTLVGEVPLLTAKRVVAGMALPALNTVPEVNDTPVPPAAAEPLAAPVANQVQ